MRFVEADHPCVRCGYSLRGLATTGECPECGNPVELSLRGDRLVHASPDYVNRLRAGSGLILWALVGLILLVMIGLIGGSVFMGIGPVLLLHLLVASAWLFAAGWWVLASPDPGQSDDRAVDLARRVIRAGAGALVLGGVLLVVPVLRDHLALGAMGLLVLGVGVVVIAGMRLVRSLARRLVDPRLYRHATTVSGMCAVCFSLLGVGTLVWLLEGLPYMRAVAVVQTPLFVVAALLGTVILVMLCGLISGLRDRLDGVAGAQAKD